MVRIALDWHGDTRRLSGGSHRVFQWYRIIGPTRLETGNSLPGKYVSTHPRTYRESNTHTIRIDGSSVQSPQFHKRPERLLALPSCTHHDGQTSSAIAVRHLDRAIENTQMVVLLLKESGIHMPTLEEGKK